MVGRLGSLCDRMVGRWRRAELVELTADVEAAQALALPISTLKTISSTTQAG